MRSIKLGRNTKRTDEKHKDGRRQRSSGSGVLGGLILASIPMMVFLKTHDILSKMIRSKVG